MHEHPHARGEAHEVPGLASVFARPSIATVLTASGLAGVTFGALFTFHQPYVLALGITRVSDFLVAYAIAAVFVRAFLGGLADRLGRLRVTEFSLGVYLTFKGFKTTPVADAEDAVRTPIAA